MKIITKLREVHNLSVSTAFEAVRQIQGEDSTKQLYSADYDGDYSHNLHILYQYVVNFIAASIGVRGETELSHRGVATTFRK